ncbi:S9 family peptidase [Massilia sp. W12]|uniref:S9 family peptidase n=1 Tax=Massilia sp. W12 TaxID=3126507 RepID=UPI0030D4C7EE
MPSPSPTPQQEAISLPGFTPEQLTQLQRAQNLALSPCGRWAAVALERLHADGGHYVCHLWRVPLDGKGKPLQLTNGDCRDSQPAFRSDGGLAFLSDRRDGESPESCDAQRRQIWLLPPHGGMPLRISDEPLGVLAFKFARNAETMAMLAPHWPGVERDQQRDEMKKRREHGPSALHYRSMPVRHWDHWLGATAPHLLVADQDGADVRDLTPDLDAQGVRALEHAEFDISADGAQIAITWSRLAPDRYRDSSLMIFTLDRDTRAIGQRLYAVHDCIQVEHPLFSPDGKALAYCQETRSMQYAPRRSLHLLDLESGDSRRLAPEWDAWPQPAAWHDDGKSLFVSAEEQGEVAIFALELGSGDVVCMTQHGSHSDLHFDVRREMLVGLRSSLRHPPEVFQLACNDSRTLDLPHLMSGFTPAKFEVRKLHAYAEDGSRIQYWLLLPPHGVYPCPALMWIHGGPINAWQDTWHWRWNPLLALAQGYAVILPNPRGSTGFGQEFVDGIWNNQWGAQCYRDLIAVLNAVSQHVEIDHQRIAAMGGSFGGYMTNWIGTQTGRFSCLVTHASVYDMRTFATTVDDPAYWYLTMGGAPFARGPEYERYSPAAHVANWRSPTLIIHGDKDYRVPVQEAQALFEALQYHGVESEMVIFPDEGHWIAKPKNTIAWYGFIFEFLQRHLKAQELSQ